MSELSTSPCLCGRRAIARTGSCGQCLEIQGSRSSAFPRANGAQMITGRSALAAVNPRGRRSIDMSMFDHPRDFSASTAFTHAFKTEPDEDSGTERGNSIDLFPASVYRRSSRTTSRTSSSRSASVFSTATSPGTTSAMKSPTTLAGTTEALASPVYGGGMIRSSSRGSPPERTYSPMAAGFARLNRKDEASTSGPVLMRRSVDAVRGGSDATLGARMFAGAA